MNIEIKKKYVIGGLLCLFFGCAGCIGVIEESSKNATSTQSDEAKKSIGTEERDLFLTENKCEVNVILSDFDKLPGQNKLREIGYKLSKKYNKKLTIVRFFLDSSDLYKKNIYARYVNDSVYIEPDAVAKSTTYNNKTEEAHKLAENNDKVYKDIKILQNTKTEYGAYVFIILTKEKLNKQDALKLCNYLESEAINVKDMRIGLQTDKEANGLKGWYYINCELTDKAPN